MKREGTEQEIFATYISIKGLLFTVQVKYKFVIFQDFHYKTCLCVKMNVFLNLANLKKSKHDHIDIYIYIYKWVLNQWILTHWILLI